MNQIIDENALLEALKEHCRVAEHGLAHPGAMRAAIKTYLATLPSEILGNKPVCLSQNEDKKVCLSEDADLEDVSKIVHCLDCGKRLCAEEILYLTNTCNACESKAWDGVLHEGEERPAPPEDKAYGYASRLFKHLAPQCTPLPTTLGVLTQLDNYIAGLREPKREMVLLDADMPADEVRLHMGEMTAQEMRTVRAAIRWANHVAKGNQPYSFKPEIEVQEGEVMAEKRYISDEEEKGKYADVIAKHYKLGKYAEHPEFIIEDVSDEILCADISKIQENLRGYSPQTELHVWSRSLVHSLRQRGYIIKRAKPYEYRVVNKPVDSQPDS